jgi:hypothetical protein
MGQNRFRHKDTKFSQSIVTTGGTTTLTADEAQVEIYTITGALATAAVIQFPYGPSDRALITVRNLTSNAGSPALRIKGFTDAALSVASAGVHLDQGMTLEAMWDGSEFQRIGDMSTPHKIRRRYGLTWQAGQYGLPQLNAVVDTDVAGAVKADKNFEILGTSAVSTDCTVYAEGGLNLATHGAANDQTILLPHLNGSGQTPWTDVTWGTDQETEWEGLIKTGASIAAAIIWAGLKLTNTPTAATNATQAFVRYQNAVTSGHFVYHADQQTGLDTGITVAASTLYHIRIRFGADRISRCYINDVCVATSVSAHTDTTDLIPYIGIQDTAAAVKNLRVIGQAIERNVA